MAAFINLFPLQKGYNDAQWDMRKQAVFDVLAPVEAAKADYMTGTYYPNAAANSDLTLKNKQAEQAVYDALTPARSYDIQVQNSKVHLDAATRALTQGDVGAYLESARSAGINVTAPPAGDKSIWLRNQATMLKAAQDYGSTRAIADNEKTFDLALKNQFAVTTPGKNGYSEQANDAFSNYEKLLKRQTDMRAADPSDPRLAQVESDTNEARARWAAYNDMMTKGAAPAPATAPAMPVAAPTTSTQPGTMGNYVPRMPQSTMSAMPAPQQAPISAAPAEDQRVTRAREWVTPKMQQLAAAFKTKQAELAASDPSHRVRLAQELQAIRSAIHADTSKMQEGLAPLVLQALGIQ